MSIAKIRRIPDDPLSMQTEEITIWDLLNDLYREELRLTKLLRDMRMDVRSCGLIMHATGTTDAERRRMADRLREISCEIGNNVLPIWEDIRRMLIAFTEGGVVCRKDEAEG